MVDDLPAALGAGAYNVYTGVESTQATGAAVPTAAQLGLEPPRYCAACGRRMTVQVRPDGWWARCSRHGRVDSSELERR
ncbi:biotin synthase auxiliary protein BsaP [Mycolicibacterium palauense]|uniref:biotin synthase auxiliary protein BsaP n=1 Tax=Mycolicibacterium palauense TaxID=2034511 RepID=UPI003898DA13